MMSTLKPAVQNSDHIRGNDQAALELVEYGDYQCPHCGRAHPIVQTIIKKMGDKLKFVFRNFPLAEIHPDAVRAAIAAEAAGAQNKYWEMHDIIFENQDNLADTDLIEYSRMAGLDQVKFKARFAEPVFREKVESDFESGIRSGVNGTPSFFINGQKYNGDWEDNILLHHLEMLK